MSQLDSHAAAMQTALQRIFSEPVPANRWPLIAEFIARQRTATPAPGWHKGARTASVEYVESAYRRTLEARLQFPNGSRHSLWVGGGAVVHMSDAGLILGAVQIAKGEVFAEYEGTDLVGIAVIKALLQLQVRACGIPENLGVAWVANFVIGQLTQAGLKDPRAYIGSALVQHRNGNTSAVGANGCEVRTDLRQFYRPAGDLLVDCTSRGRIDFLAGEFDTAFAGLVADHLAGTSRDVLDEPAFLGQLRFAH